MIEHVVGDEPFSCPICKSMNYEYLFDDSRPLTNIYGDIENYQCYDCGSIFKIRSLEPWDLDSYY